MIDLRQGDAFEVLATLPDESVDSIVTDPPYGLSTEPDVAEVLRHWLAGDDYTHQGGGFMGKSWDSFVPGPKVWAECLRVLKPGGFLLCFAGSRTVDLMGISIRLAGFEIRDQIQWLYGSGFPKSLNVGKAIDKAAGAERPVVDAARWEGWGTALKPAHEPIILARKPVIGTVANNVLSHGTGALNIDDSRIAASGRPLRESHGTDTEGKNTYGSGGPGGGSKAVGSTDLGRFPANVVLAQSPGRVRTGRGRGGHLRRRSQGIEHR